MTKSDQSPSSVVNDPAEAVGIDSTGTEEPEYQFPPFTGLVGPASGTATVVIVASELLSLGVFGIIGVALLGAGIARGSHQLNLLGFGLLVGTILLGAILQLSTIGIVTSMAAAIVAYDAGRYAIGLGNQLRENASAPQAELFHIGGTTVVAGVLAAGTYAGYQFLWGGQPVSAVILLLIAAALLFLVLRTHEDA